MTEENYDFNIADWEIASPKKMINYSFGFIISLYLSLAYNALIFYFYEVEVGLNTGLVSLAIIIYAIYNMLSAPLLGYLTDKPFKWSRKWGFRAPWVIFAAIPAFLFYFLLYIPPSIDAKANPWILFWYLVIISCLFSTFFSIFNAHYSGGFANHFRQDFERRKASALAFIFPGLILFFLSLLPLFIIVYGDKSTFALTALISVIVMFVCLIILIPGIRESEEVKKRYLQGYEEERLSFFKMMKFSLGSKNFRISLFAFTLVNIATVLNMASGIYFFKDVLKLPLYLSIFPTIVYFLALMIAVPLWVIFAGKHGTYKTILVGLLLSGIGYIPYLWITTIEEAMIFAIFRGVGGSCYTVMVMPILSDCYDEVTLVCGKHQEATLVGIRNIFNRSSIIFQAIIIGIVHIMTNYNPNPNAIQTPLAVWGIRIHRALIPMILVFSAFLLMVFFYDLKGDKKLALKADMRKKGL